MSRQLCRILIVDDDEATRYVKSHLLRRQGYQIYEANCGRDALALAESRGPGLVLLDVKLPDADGIETCCGIKTRFPQIIVLRTSARPRAGARRRRQFRAGRVDCHRQRALRMRKAEHDVRRKSAP